MIWRDVTTLVRITKNLDPEQEVKPLHRDLVIANDSQLGHELAVKDALAGDDQLATGVVGGKSLGGRLPSLEGVGAASVLGIAESQVELAVRG